MRLIHHEELFKLVLNKEASIVAKESADVFSSVKLSNGDTSEFYALKTGNKICDTTPCAYCGSPVIHETIKGESETTGEPFELIMTHRRY